MEFEIAIETISESLWDYFCEDVATVNYIVLKEIENYDCLSIDHDQPNHTWLILQLTLAPPLSGVFLCLFSKFILGKLNNCYLFSHASTLIPCIIFTAYA